MKTLDLANTVQFGISRYSGERSVRYTACPHCGGEIHRYPRMAWPHGFRLFGKCACGWAAWEWEETEAILARLGAHRQLTMVSGYHAYPEPPQANVCPFCNDGPCVAMCEPPADDRAYLAAWRAGAFDDDLVGFAEAEFYTLTERVMSGE